MNIICKLQNVSCLFYFSYAVSVVAVNSAVGIAVSVASAVFRIPTTVSVDQAAVAAAVVTNSLEYLIAAEPAVVAAQPEVVAFADHEVEASCCCRG